MANRVLSILLGFEFKKSMEPVVTLIPTPGANVHRFNAKNAINAETNPKIYFDHGTTTLDAEYEPFQHKADAVMKAAGYSISDWLSKSFPGQDHSERAWRSRVHIPLTFLLSN